MIMIIMMGYDGCCCSGYAKNISRSARGGAAMLRLPNDYITID